MGTARIVASALIAAGAITAMSAAVNASSHREAPLITETPKVDGTDFYMFRSYEPGRAGFVTLVADYLPLQDPYGGPNYYELDPDAVYEIHIDNNGSANPAITFQFRFHNAQQQIALSIGGTDVPVPLVDVGPISAGDNSKLNVIQTYNVSVIRAGAKPESITNASTGSATFEKPVDNIGEKTLPNYAAYAAAHIFDISIPGCGPGRMFVGQRKDPFVVNLGETFDLINIAHPVGEQFNNSGRDDLADKNVTSLILEVPIACLATGGEPVIGGWTTASKCDVETIDWDNVRRGQQTLPKSFHRCDQDDQVQLSRLGSPLVNELVIGLPDKDRFNASRPADDTQFATYVTNPTFPAIVETFLSSVNVEAPTLFPRDDLVATFLTGIKSVNQPHQVTPAEMLRLSTLTPPTAAGRQNRLGVIANDPAGFPNGRRPGDDVIDIVLRVAMGRLISLGLFGTPEQAPSGALDFTDGALVDDSFFDASFPYLKTPLPGSPGQAAPSQPPS
jgi:hypothetical protein